MSNRVTAAHLEAIVNRINRLTNSPTKPYEMIDGKYKANIGCYHLSQAYGGYALHRMSNECGGVTDSLSRGHMPKRELAELMYAYIRGIEQNQDLVLLGSVEFTKM